jgi:hypothetical protein
VTTESAWFAARPSGTEDVYKIYAESFRGPEHLAALRNMVHAAAKELPDLRVAMITIMGVIKEGTELSPSEISRYFLALLEERDPAVETVLPVR